MARKRTIDPDLWTDDRVQQLPTLLAVLLYIGTISHADDEGRLEWNARQLYAKVFPVRDDVKIRDIEVAMTALVESGLLEVYGNGTRRYAVHPAWKRHQYVNRPSKSKYPAPAISLLDSVEPSVRPSVNDSREDVVSGSVRPHVPSESVPVSDTDSDTLPSEARSPGFERPDAKPLTTPFGLADWLWAHARQRGLIGGHHDPTRDAEVKRDAKAAKVLLETYELAEVLARAERLLDGVAAGQKIAPTAAGLAKAWDWAWVAGRALQRAADEPNKSDNLPILVDGDLVS